MKNRTKKVVANFTRDEAEKKTKGSEKPNNIFKLMKFVKNDVKDIEGGKCVIGKEN